MDKVKNTLDKWLEGNYPDYSHIERLYHYTSVDTLECLTRKDGDFLLTYYEDLNDWSEVNLGRKIIIECLQDAFPVFKDKGFRDRINRGFDEYICTKRYFMPWIASFSAECDSLYQWIAYTPREVGGVAVSLNKHGLIKKVQAINTAYGGSQWDEDPKPLIYLVPCLYLKREEGVLVEFLRFLIGPYLEGVGAQCKTSEGFLTALFEVVMIGSSMIKHEAFHFEREWRVVLLPNEESRMKDSFVLNGKKRVWSGLWGRDRSLGGNLKEVMISPHGDKLLYEKVKWIRDTRSLSFGITRSAAPFVG